MIESGSALPREQAADEESGEREDSPSEPDGHAEGAADDAERTSSRLPLPTWLLVVVVAAIVLVTYSALRIAGEQRYQSCVQAVGAQIGNASDSLSRLVRQSTVKRCSHSPF